MSVLEYKGYHTRVEFVPETCTIRGQLEGIRDYVDFETDDLTKVEDEFHLAVDDYLACCADLGMEPDKEYKGSFNVRIPPELHKKLAQKAFKNDTSLNSAVEEAITKYVAKA